MSENKEPDSELTIKSDGISVRGTAYDDLRPVVKGVVGIAAPLLEVLGTLTGISARWVNQKLFVIGQRYEQKLLSVPEEHRQLPPLEIAASVYRGAVIASDDYELRELFAELLASASDERRVKAAHPAFGTLICELEPLDAKVMALFPRQCGRIVLQLHEVVGAIGIREDDSQLQVSVSNLIRQGLVEKASPTKSDLAALRLDHYLGSSLKLEVKAVKDILVKILDNTNNDFWPLRLTPFGARFIEACMPEC